MQNTKAKKKYVCLLSLAEKNRVSRSDVFFLNIFFILKFCEFGFLELLFVIFLYLLTVLNTQTVDDINPFGSRKRQNFPDI
jgi:hypothetical protein